MKVTVVGDILLDCDTQGSAQRLSPDGPVPVVTVERRSHRPGGAGLAAQMLCDDGHDVTLVTSFGDDDRADLLRDLLSGVTVLAAVTGGATPMKERVIAGGHVVARLDSDCEPAGRGVLCATDDMLRAIGNAECLLVADYGRGLTEDADVRDALTRRAQRVPLVWDPHPRGAEPVAGTTAVTPNFGEATTFAPPEASGSQAAVSSAEKLLRMWPVSSVVVTLGDRGALVLPGTGQLPQFIPLPAGPSSTDTCGAGDRFAGGLAVQLGSGAPLQTAAASAVALAARYLTDGGVSGPGPGASQSQDTRTREPVALASRIAALRRTGSTVVATGGCFDLVHAGHVRTLSTARELGDYLVVCINSDESVRRLKGEERPFVSQDDRVELLEALGCVDAVVVFDEDTPDNILETLRPDLWVKGGDYDAETLPETDLVHSWGGRTVTVPYLPARSTSGLAEKLNAPN